MDSSVACPRWMRRRRQTSSSTQDAGVSAQRMAVACVGGRERKRERMMKAGSENLTAFCSRYLDPGRTFTSKGPRNSDTTPFTPLHRSRWTRSRRRSKARSARTRTSAWPPSSGSPRPSHIQARRSARHARAPINARVAETGFALASLTVNQQTDPTIRQVSTRSSTPAFSAAHTRWHRLPASFCAST